MYASSRKGFTLIELLVVIAIIAILAVVVVLTLNPAELLRQARDSNRLSDMSTLVHAIGIYQEDLSAGSMGSASTTYLSIPDSSATSTAGDACQALGMSTSTSWHCASSTYYRQVNGTGWLPINFASTSMGSPLGNLPVDPVNQTSSNLFYTYQTNGNQYEVTATMESQKYQSIEANDGGQYSNLFEQGTNLALAAMDFGGGNKVPQTIQFSDNFNSGNTQGWTVIGSGVSFASSEVQVVINNANGTHRIDSTSTPFTGGVGSSPLWATYQVYIPAGYTVPSGDQNLISGLNSSSTSDPIAAVGFQSTSGNLYWEGFYFTNGTEYANTNPSSLALTTGVWHTVEVYTKFASSGGGEFAYWVDGNLMADETGLTNNNESVGKVILGENYSPSAETITADYDNLFVYTGSG
jgi:prepilin-type N-terminal cleavage/methylation domain-containing protein